MLPRLLHFANFELFSYGFFVCIGAFTGLALAARRAKAEGIDPSAAFGLGITAILSGVLGAKILFVLLNWNFYAEHPGSILSLNTLQAGGVFSGGLVAALVTCSVYIHRHELPILMTADVFAPALAAGHAIGRLGCFAAGCCYGRPSTYFWGITFTDPLAGRISGTPLGVALEPTQLFESLAEMTNFCILLFLFRRKQFNGQAIAAYLLLYGIERFLLEFLRGDPGRGEVLGGLLSGTQGIALFLLMLGLFIMTVQKLRHMRQRPTSTIFSGSPDQKQLAANLRE